MKIIATVRTLNEEKNIEKFCKSYSEFADLILVADGGSTDNTKSIASQFPKVKVRDYLVKVPCQNGILRNPDGPHIQFLIDWAIEEGGDWIVHQDCDQRPNKYLKEDIREIMEKTGKDFLQFIQVFLWGKDQWFPEMSKLGDRWMCGLWAWRLSAGIKIVDKMPHYEFSFDGINSIDINKLGREQNFEKPYCYMHYGWETPELTMQHIDYYRKSGLIPNMAHPLQFGGHLETLENWMIE